MCTVVILYRPAHHWPVLVASNRDEMADRPWRPPARHWPDRVDVVAGLDVLGGGTWLGMNDAGVVATVLNRINTLGPDPEKRSRGELPLEALDHAEAARAVEALGHIDPAAYRPFNMVVADRREAFWLRHTDQGVRAERLDPGISMVTAYDRNDTEGSTRQRLYLPRFRKAAPPDPDAGDWGEWQALLASREHEPGHSSKGALCVVTETGFGTTCGSLLALPAPERHEAPAHWLFAAGRPGEAEFRRLEL